MVYKILLFFVYLLSFSYANADIKQINSFKSQFTQTITSPSGKVIEYKGDVFIVNTGKILWKYKTPIIKDVYVKKDLVIIVEPELEQVIYTQLEKQINIIELLNNAHKIENNKYKTKIDNIDYLIVLDNKTKKIVNISYEDKLENQVVIDFKNTIENEKIDDSIFSFERPDYYDVIRK